MQSKTEQTLKKKNTTLKKELAAKNRDLEIEAALEKVRARALAMHHTSEIQAVIHTVHQVLLKLDLSIFGGSFIVVNKDVDSELYAWGSGGTAETATEMLVPDFGMPFCTNLLKGIKKGPGFFTEEFSRKEKIKYFTELFKHQPWSKIPAKDKKAVLESEGGYTRSVCVANHTSILIINQNGRKFTEEENNILRRFSKVFEQSYTRFLDLQKAEEQAREAQIETALEKVRSRSLGMHKSEELQEVVNTVFERLKALEMDMNVASIFIFKEGSKDWQQWVATSTTNYSSYFHIPYVNLQIFRDLEKAKKSGKDFYSKRYSFKQKNEWFNYAFANTEYSRIPVDRKKFLIESEFFQVSFALAKNTGIQLAKYSGKDFTEKENKILIRFSRVFEQAYTRFLDLQKAEAQAREAEIELALERVRARTMAMQKSEELKDVVKVMNRQFDSFAVAEWGCSIMIFDKKANRIENWVAESTNSDLSCYIIEGQRHPVYKRLWKHWEQQAPTITLHHADEVKREFDNFWLYETDYKRLPDEVKSSVLNEREVFLTYSSMHHGMISIAGYKQLSARSNLHSGSFFKSLRANLYPIP